MSINSLKPDFFKTIADTTENVVGSYLRVAISPNITYTNTEEKIAKLRAYQCMSRQEDDVYDYFEYKQLLEEPDFQDSTLGVFYEVKARVTDQIHDILVDRTKDFDLENAKYNKFIVFVCQGSQPVLMGNSIAIAHTIMENQDGKKSLDLRKSCIPLRSPLEKDNAFMEWYMHQVWEKIKKVFNENPDKARSNAKRLQERAKLHFQDRLG